MYEATCATCRTPAGLKDTEGEAEASALRLGWERRESDAPGPTEWYCPEHRRQARVTVTGSYLGSLDEHRKMAHRLGLTFRIVRGTLVEHTGPDPRGKKKHKDDWDYFLGLFGEPTITTS
jgi:hypothetical protein